MKFEHFDVLDEDISPNQVNISSLVINKTLNPQIWAEFTLRPNIITKIMPVVDEYVKFMLKDLDSINVVDIYFTGSLANYNWSRYSDFDVHVVVDYVDINEDVEFVSKYFKDRSELFAKGTKLCIFNFDVEFNMNDIVDLRKDAGVYSLLKNEWIQQPDINNICIDYDIIKRKTAKLVNDIDNNIEDPATLVTIKKKINKMRNTALEKEGEFSNENLVFKLLRRSGYLTKLKNIINKPQ